MRHAIILLVGISMLISVPAVADQAADEAAIRKAMDDLLTIYNKHDENAFAALWDEKTILFTTKAEGSTEIAGLIAGIFERHKRSIQSRELEELGLDFVTADVAVLRVRLEFTQRYDREGNQAPDRKAEIGYVLVKKNGKWLFSAAFERTMVE
jgi:ketosteroid isomerase-like protein